MQRRLCDVASGSRQTSDQTGRDRVTCRREHDRDDRRRPLGRGDGEGRGATFDMTRPVTFITVRAESGLGPAVLCTRARPVCIAQASSTATHVRSNRSAAQRNHHARSRAISMSMLETLPGRWPAPRASSGSGMSGKKIEMRFAHLKRILKLGRLRLCGPRGAQDVFVLAAIAQNLRRLASLVARPPPAHALCIA